MKISISKTSIAVITATIFIALTLAYRIELLLKEPYAFMTITNPKAIPSYFKNVRYNKLDNYLPGITATTLANTQLSDMLAPESLYKIVTPEAFDPSIKNSSVTLSALDKKSKFIHAAMGTQVFPILEKFFKDTPTVLLLEIDKQKLQSANLTLKNEQNKAGGELFPHLYGTQKIPLSIIKTVIEISKNGQRTIAGDTHWNMVSIGIIMPCFPPK